MCRCCLANAWLGGLAHTHGALLLHHRFCLEPLLSLIRMSKKIKFGPEIFYGNNPDAVPYVQLSPLDDEIVASYTGPGSGLAYAEGHTQNSYFPNLVAGIRDWTCLKEQAFGVSVSLYEQHPISGRISGEPIADSFALCVRRNNAILMVADGVNWGEKSRLAARCALYGSMKFLNYKIFDRKSKPENTQDVVRLLRKALDEAHRAIIAKSGGLTTLCLCMVCEVANSDQHAVCCVNVGDSLAFIYSANQAIREITVGSHDVGSERDIRDAGGALGPVNGVDPELHNLTCSVTFCHRGDIVFLTTDGISDNFDPVVTKIALPMRAAESKFISKEKYSSTGSLNIKPELSPKERHIYALKEMERVVHEYELITEEGCTAQSFCGALLQHVLMLTNDKRKIVENPAIYDKCKKNKKDRPCRDSEVTEKMSKAPGKLDHASVVALEVGAYLETDISLKSCTDNEFVTIASLNCANQQAQVIPDSPPTPTRLPLCGSIPLSPTAYSAKKSGRNIFAKLRSLPSSPTTQYPPTQLSTSVPTHSFRCISPPHAAPQSPTSPSDFTPHCLVLRQSKPANSNLNRNLDLQLPPPKFPKRIWPKTSDMKTPTSPTPVK